MNNWYLSQHEEYEEAKKYPFSKYAQDATLQLPVAPWLVNGNAESISPIYPKDCDPRNSTPCHKFLLRSSSTLLTSSLPFCMSAERITMR